MMVREWNQNQLNGGGGYMKCESESVSLAHDYYEVKLRVVMGMMMMGMVDVDGTCRLQRNYAQDHEMKI